MLKNLSCQEQTERSNDPAEFAGESNRARRFEMLVRRHSREIRLFLQKLCGRPEDAEELAQDVFVKAYRKLDSLRDDRAARRWLYRIAINRFNDWLKPKRRAAMRTVEGLDLEPLARLETAPEPRMMGRELSHWLDDAIRSLPDRQRTVLVLHVDRGLDYAAISETLGITPDAVKMSLFHAREKLRHRLGDSLDEGASDG